MGRKRRTVLWLYQEDYDYLTEMSELDGEGKNATVRCLLRALRNAGCESIVEASIHFATTYRPKVEKKVGTKLAPKAITK